MLIVAIVACKNWYRGLCYMLPLLAFLERPDMPKQMLGIGGLNPFNILLAIILLAWLVQRRIDGSRWSADRTISRLFVVYMIVISIATIRLLLDLDTLQYYSALAKREEIPSMGDLITSEVVNTGKWLLLGLLVSVGAQSEDRIRLLLFAILLTGSLLAVQIISKMLPGLTGADDLASRALRVLDRDLGYHRVDLAAIMSSVAWAFLASQTILKTRLKTVIALGGFGLCTLAMIATGGRAGMMSWAACALAVGFLRWRKLLMLTPLAAILAVMVIPGLQERLLAGFSSSENDSAEQIERRAAMGAIDAGGRDQYAITSGRIVVWPRVIAKALEAPIIGHGREAMQRTGVVAALDTDLNITSFGHPHNAYLEIFIDTGLIGVIVCGAFFWILLRRSAAEFASPSNNTKFVVAAATLSFLVVNLTASLGSQSFYPTQGATLFWVVIGLALARLGPTETQPVRSKEALSNLSLRGA